MAPIHAALAQLLQRDDTSTPGFEATPTSTISDAGAWSGSFTVASVDLIAMIVSDAGLSSSTPEWWNCSPLGCLLIGIQPRGGWQVMQRAVQWGDDYLSRAFGIKSDVSDLYKFFACSVRNRLEVWNSEDFISPTKKLDYVPKPSKRGMIVEWTAHAPLLQKTARWFSEVPARLKGRRQHSPTPAPEVVVDEKPSERDPEEDNPKAVREWIQGLHADEREPFNVHRPTKLIEGSKGGPAFICSLLKPQENDSYSIATQARMQMLSVLLVAAGLTHRKRGGKEKKPGVRFQRVLEEDMGMSFHFSSIFDRFLVGLVVADLLLLSYIVLTYYSLFRHNYFQDGIPYAMQLASLSSWSVGAVGLLGLGGNPRVRITSSVCHIPRHILERLYELPEGFFDQERLKQPATTSTTGNNGGEGATRKQKEEEERLELALEECQRKADDNGDIALHFGYLQSTNYASNQDTCTITFDEAKMICGLSMKLDRRCQWYFAFFWFVLHLLLSICLQIFGSSVATLGSQVLGVLILVSTSLLRGAGIASPEEWMIPGFRMREGAHYGANPLSRTESR